MGANSNLALNGPTNNITSSGIIKDQRRDQSQGGSRMRLALYLAPIILLACEHAKPANAILNCFAPNMFKMNKGYPGAERANWYPQQSQLPPVAGYQQPGGYAGHNPMKYLFQPKWKSGGLFGAKGWNSWKMGANSNYQRPNIYGGSYTGSMVLPPAASYPIGADQMSMSPYAMHQAFHSYNDPTVSNPNDGWSTPVSYNNQQQLTPIQQSLLNTYESYTQAPAKQQLAIDPYGTKGSSGANNKYTTSSTTTTKNAYGYYDGSTKQRTYGYAYPEWYSGVVDSPAKIAQQLMKYGYRKQLNRSAPLINPSVSTSTGQFTILDEPRFVGFGSIDLLSNKEARLGCSFNEAIDQTNRPLWVKFVGPYNSSQVINGKNVPPFNCANSQCRTQEIESTKDYRYQFDNGPATSTLIIKEPRLSDYGIYRCSALTKAINNNPLETVYQIVQLGGIE